MINTSNPDSKIWSYKAETVGSDNASGSRYYLKEMEVKQQEVKEINFHFQKKPQNVF